MFQVSLYIFLSQYVFINTGDFLFSNTPLLELVDVLHLPDNKLIPLDELTLEKSVYWYQLASYIQSKSERTEGESDIKVIPDLLPFLNYIERCVSFRNM